MCLPVCLFFLFMRGCEFFCVRGRVCVFGWAGDGSMAFLDFTNILHPHASSCVLESIGDADSNSKNKNSFYRHLKCQKNV